MRRRCGEGMAQPDKKKSEVPVISIITVILVILAIGFWFLAQEPARQPKPVAMKKNETADRETGRRIPARVPRHTSGRSGSSLGAGMIAVETAVFAGRDIHDVPLGQILDYAQRLPYDESRGHAEVLGTNSSGQTVKVSIWPESGASSQVATALGQGQIVARIESNHGYEKLGLAGGLNYLWVEARPNGGYRGVIVPATAFVPLHDLERVSLTEQTPRGVPLEKGAYWVNGQPWIACGRC